MDMPSPKKITPEGLSAEPLTVQRPKPRRWALIRRLILMAALMVAILGGLYFFEKFKEGMIAGFISAPRPPTPVAAVTVTTAAMPRYLDGIGSVRAVHQVTISPELSGRVVKIMFESGASVQAGDPLVQLNDEPEQADLATFKAQARLAEVTLGRNRKLANQQYTAQQTVDQNESDLAVAQAGITHSQAVIAEKLVRAPFSGQLGVRQIEVGQFLNAGTPIVTLTDLDNLYVDFTLPEQTRADLTVGQAVEIRVDAFKGRVFQAKLTTIEPQLDPEMRSIKVQASLHNPQHLLLPGMFGAARVLLSGPAQCGDAAGNRSRLQRLWRIRLHPEAQEQGQGRTADLCGRADLREDRTASRWPDRHHRRRQAGRVGGQRGAGEAACRLGSRGHRDRRA